MTLDEIIALVQAGKLTAAEAAAQANPYALRFAEPATRAEDATLREIRAAYDAQRPVAADPIARPAETLVRCSCGHSVPSIEVMSASLGTTCSDCYDRMSD